LRICCSSPLAHRFCFLANLGLVCDRRFHNFCSNEPLMTGKTTIVREITRILAERYNVYVVDTSSEIAGFGDIPHPCIGHARRLMIPTVAKQSAVMIEAVQNHTPTVMVIDEIGRKTEVEAAQTCKNRGVRMIASAHGDLRKLIKNQQIRGVIGGIESVTLGDAAARIEGWRANVQSQG
jgi:stage III sporulation protein SpoIIIAA